MNKQRVYRALLRLYPKPRYRQRYEGLLGDVAAILSWHRVKGAVFAVFREEGIIEQGVFGFAGRGMPVAADTFFRVASVSKMITALCVMKLYESGLADIDRDVSSWLPFALRHPLYRDDPITLRMLMSHTSGIRDGADYMAGVHMARPAEELLTGDSFSNSRPGDAWAYSNFGAGLVGSVLEGMTGLSFEQAMQRHLFKPLGVTASFYPQRIDAPLADAVRLLPPGRPGFNAEERKKRTPLSPDTPMPGRHYGLAQGNCCIDARGVHRLCRALMAPGFLKQATLDVMRRPHAPFGERSRFMKQGLGLFLIDSRDIASRVLFGHQGNAYGAMHGVFFDIVSRTGMLFMSSSASEARTEFLSDVNRALLVRYAAFMEEQGHG